MKTNAIAKYTMPGMINPVRDYECSNGHKWTATPILSATTRNLSGEQSQSCPECGKLHSFGSSVYDASLAESMPRTAHDLLPGESFSKPIVSDISGSYRTPDGKAQIDFGITYRNGYPEYTSSGHFDGASGQCLDSILAAYPENVMVQDLHSRWNKFHLKDVSKHPALIDKTRRGAENFPASDFMEDQASTFLSRNGLKFRATLSDSKTPAWAKEVDVVGHHYRVTISRSMLGESCLNATPIEKTKEVLSSRLAFDFWGSTADAKVGKTEVRPYDVLAGISGDAYTPETFADFCAEYRYESDSIKALQQFRRCDRFAKRLRAFFTETEIQELSEIR